MSSPSTTIVTWWVLYLLLVPCSLPELRVQCDLACEPQAWNCSNYWTKPRELYESTETILGFFHSQVQKAIKPYYRMSTSVGSWELLSISHHQTWASKFSLGAQGPNHTVTLSSFLTTTCWWSDVFIRTTLQIFISTPSPCPTNSLQWFGLVMTPVAAHGLLDMESNALYLGVEFGVLLHLSSFSSCLDSMSCSIGACFRRGFDILMSACMITDDPTSRMNVRLNGVCFTYLQQRRSVKINLRFFSVKNKWNKTTVSIRHLFWRSGSLIVSSQILEQFPFFSWWFFPGNLVVTLIMVSLDSGLVEWCMMVSFAGEASTFRGDDHPYLKKYHVMPPPYQSLSYYHSPQFLID